MEYQHQHHQRVKDVLNAFMMGGQKGEEAQDGINNINNNNTRCYYDALALAHCSNAKIRNARTVEFDVFVDAKLTNRYGTLHGGCVATLVDVLTTAALLVHLVVTASAREEKEEEGNSFNNEDDDKEDARALEHSGGGVTTDLSCTFAKAAYLNETIKATCEVVRKGNQLAFLRCTFSNEKGEVVAFGHHTKFIGLVGKRRSKGGGGVAHSTNNVYCNSNNNNSRL